MWLHKAQMQDRDLRPCGVAFGASAILLLGHFQVHVFERKSTFNKRWQGKQQYVQFLKLENSFPLLGRLGYNIGQCSHKK